MGWGTILYDWTNVYEEIRNKPCVDYTQTMDDYLRRGYGYRRLKIMDALSRAIFAEPLHSSSLRQEEAGFVWQKLCRNGEAVHYVAGPDNDRFDRYVFKD